jgi:hypothetical protein
MEREVSRGIPDDEATKAFVADQNVRTEAEHKIRKLEVTRDQDGIRKLVGGGSFEIEIGWSANAKRGVWRENLVTSESRCGVGVPVIG